MCFQKQNKHLQTALFKTIGELTKLNPYGWHPECKAVKVHYSLCYCHFRGIFKTEKSTERGHVQ